MSNTRSKMQARQQFHLNKGINRLQVWRMLKMIQMRWWQIEFYRLEKQIAVLTQVFTGHSIRSTLKYRFLKENWLEHQYPMGARAIKHLLLTRKSTNGQKEYVLTATTNFQLRTTEPTIYLDSEFEVHNPFSKRNF